MYDFVFCRNLAYIYEQSLYLISRDAEKGIFKATQQQQNRKAKQHNTTRPNSHFSKTNWPPPMIIIQWQVIARVCEVLPELRQPKRIKRICAQMN